MLTNTQKDRIESLYVEYQQDIKPLTFYVERKYHKFPKALLKEFRDVFDHISRCYEIDVDEKYIEDNIRKAENHFDRIKLDTFKYVSDYKRREFTRWKKKYSKYDIQAINDGNFWERILKLEDDGERLFVSARNNESKDIVKACELFQDSTTKYDEIRKLIDDKRSLILRVKFKYTRIKILYEFIGLLLGILGSIIAAVIMKFFF